MDHRISLFPQPGDEPSSRMCGTDGTIPVLSLAGDYGHVEIAFHRDPDVTLVYLTALIREVMSLAEQVRRRQRAEELLAAVQETPSDPQAADRIRAEYADEVTS